MKIIFILALSVCALLAHAQKPPKKSSKIVVSADTAGVFNKIVLSLYDLGYTIESRDDVNKFVLSGEKEFGSYSIKMKALVKDSSIVFSGFMASNVSISIYGAKTERAFGSVYFGGMKGSPLRDAWEKLENFALSFGATISYGQ